uniref:Lipoprotein n=1 Tax=Cacopsylla melanoneura TaxID=428564 RepID=A0A8D8YCZ0_9HEMI
MFRTRASFQLGLKSILYLFLACAFNEKVSSTPQFGFGCSFANDEYNYYTYLYRYKKTPPVWSQLAMKSYAVDNFENIEKPLKNLFSEASIQNELSLFTE